MRAPLHSQNLLFDSDHPRTRRLKLVDFGLSCALNDARSLLHGACGTPVYSAPEVFAQRYDGVRADLWSAGVTLYVMLTGRLPFEVEAPISGGAVAMTTSGRRGSVGTKSGFGTLAHASTRTSGSSAGHQLVNSSSNSNIISGGGIGSGSSSNNTSTSMGVANTSRDGLGSRDSLGGGNINGSGTASSGRVRASDFELLAQRVQSGRFRMPAHVSPAAADLLRAMLDPDPAARPLHDGIRQHAWCRAHGVFSENATAAQSVTAAVAAEEQATTAAAAALVGSATDSAVDSTEIVHVTETTASFPAPGSVVDPVIASDAYFTVSLSTEQSSELSNANSNTAALVVSPLASYPSVRTSSDAWWESEPATGFNASSYAHSFSRPSVSRSLSNAQSSSTSGAGSGSLPSSSSSSGYSESAALAVKGAASSSTFSTPQRARTISSVAFVGVGGIAPALRQSSSGFLSPGLVGGSGTDATVGSDTRNRAAGRSRSNSHGGSLGGFDSSAEVDVASMTPLAAARSLSQSWSMRASASEKGMGGGGLSGAYAVARGTSASHYPTTQPTGSLAAASLAASSTSSALKTSTSLTASSASWSSSWAAARASNNASPMPRTVSFTSSSVSVSVVAPAPSSTFASAVSANPIVNGNIAYDCGAGAVSASFDAVFASPSLAAVSATAAATSALATLHLSPPLLSTAPPSLSSSLALSSALMPVFNLGVSNSVSLPSDEGLSMAIDADSSVLPTIDEREPVRIGH
jgi:hypothetical protein